jgi:hypothetical protein
MKITRSISDTLPGVVAEVVGVVADVLQIVVVDFDVVVELLTQINSFKNGQKITQEHTRTQTQVNNGLLDFRNMYYYQYFNHFPPTPE